jgi:hypothetical protein
MITKNRKVKILLINGFAMLLFTMLSCSVSKSAITQENEIRVSTPEEVLLAVKNAQPGDIILVKGGNYLFDKRIDIKIDGTAQAKITIKADPSDSKRPRFDFSALGEGDSNQGIILRTSYWHIKGIDIVKAGDNGILISGGHDNTIEFCSFSECSDTGLQMVSGAANNLILNCDSYFNADSKIENADGFACKIDVGTGNKFVGCRAWQNLDDGWDGYLKRTDSVNTTYENCWAFSNGLLKSGMPSGGDGNGFKTGGSDDKLLKHNATYTDCISAGNLKDGFAHNSNRGAVTLIDCKMFDNKEKNLAFGSKNQVSVLIIKNALVFGEKGSLHADVLEIENNSWQNDRVLEATDFQSLDISELSKPRQSDGSLPEISFMKLK